MQAIIMAAGKGSRIHHLTNGLPKSFLQINGESLIDRNIEMIQEQGIRDIAIVVGYRADAFHDRYDDMPGITLIDNPFYEMTNVIGSFWMGRNALHDDFIYWHADTICEKTLFEDLLQEEGEIVLPVDTKPLDEEAMKVQLDETGQVVKLTKKMPVEQAAGEFIGIAKMSKRVIPALQAAATALMWEKAFDEYFEAAIQRLIDQKKFDIRMMDTKRRFWAEVDFEEDYQRACKQLKD